jgi:hypothetical protein
VVREKKTYLSQQCALFPESHTSICQPSRKPHHESCYPSSGAKSLLKSIGIFEVPDLFYPCFLTLGAESMIIVVKAFLAFPVIAHCIPILECCFQACGVTFSPSNFPTPKRMERYSKPLAVLYMRFTILGILLA